MNGKANKIIILHSHLRPGGVSRIISSQVKALTDAGVQVEVITGESPQDKSLFPVSISLVPEINYFSEDLSLDEKVLRQELIKIESSLAKCLTEDCILHAHNLNLGKNPLVTMAVKKLADKGLKVFNHAHDFAEDRAANFELLEKVISGVFQENLNQFLYPKLDNYRFGVLNRFDYNRLIDMGIADDRVNFLPNPVADPGFKPEPNSRIEVCKEFGIDDGKILLVYPVRVIRRKNIGELILLAHLFRDEAEFIVTLPPQNPVERDPYDQWLDFCNRNIISNIHFEAGTIFSFDQIMSAADKCITTSIKEGFGMMFLEPWMFNNAVVGRNIASVTADFKETGLQFDCLYNAIKINFEDYKASDFGFLAQEEQMECLEMILEDASLAKQVLVDNPELEYITHVAMKEDITRNQEIIKSEYSLRKYGAKLNEIYAEFY